MHLWNSNCDALENRKSKRELLRELEVWEKTQGGSANTAEPKVMRKDFDGQAHASTHKSQFDGLIANAKRKREAAKAKKEEEAKEDREKEEARLNETAPQNTEPEAAPQPVDVLHPYEGNETALASVREKVEQANRVDSTLPSMTSPIPTLEETRLASQECQGMPNPFGSPTRKVPMFALPADPIVDVEQSTTIQ